MSNISHTKPLFDVDGDPIDVIMPSSASASIAKNQHYNNDDTTAILSVQPNGYEELIFAEQQQSSRRQHLSSLRHKIKNFVLNWKWPLMLFSIWLTVGIIVLVYRKQFLQLLETLSHKLADIGTSGYLLMASLIFASAFPPMIGYGLYQTLSGYTFGFLIGFPVSYFSALFGAIACFLLSRTFFKHRVTRTLSQYPNLEAAVKAAEKKGFKLFLLIRLSPYPFNLLNVLFAATHLPLSYFAAGTAISLLKIALHVYVGATLTSFVKHVLGNDEDARTEGEIRAEKIKYIFVGLSALLGMGVMIYLYQVVKVAVAETVKLDSAASNEEELSFLHDDDTTEEDDYDEETHIGLASIKQDMMKHIDGSPRHSIDTWADWGEENDSNQTKSVEIPMKKRD